MEELREAEQEAKREAEEDTTDAEPDAENTSGIASLDKEIQPVEEDALLEEAGRILMDLIGLTMQIAQLESVPPALAPGVQTPPAQARATDG